MSAAASVVTDLDLPAEVSALEEIENLIETGRHDEAETALARAEPALSATLAQAIMGTAAPSATGKTRAARPGYLVINPLNVPRRAAVILPDAALDLRPDGPLRAAQFTDQGVWAVVDLPAFGFAWVPREADQGRQAASSTGLSTRGRTLKNESIEIEIDAATGGLRSVAGVGEPTARLGQQLVMTGLFDCPGKTGLIADAVRSVRRRLRRARARAGNRGRHAGPSATRNAPGLVRPTLSPVDRRPILEIEITLADLDPPGWTGRPRPTRGRSIWRADGLGPIPTRCCAERCYGLPSSPSSSDRRRPMRSTYRRGHRRTALLFGGLPYHRKHGSRMLDTLLVAGMESTRSFTLGAVLDLEHPFHAAQDLLAQALVVPIARRTAGHRQHRVAGAS